MAAPRKTDNMVVPSRPKRIVKHTTAPKEHTTNGNLFDLSSLIPGMDVWDSYVSRTIHGVRDIELLEAARDENWNTLIEGPTGSGKTHYVMACAAKYQAPFYSIGANAGKTLESMKGFRRQNEAGKWVWQDGPLTAFVRAEGLRFLLFNEIGFMPDRISSGTFSLFDSRRMLELEDKDGEVIVASPGLVIVADTNPGYQGTRELNAAFRNRFAQKLSWDYDPRVESQLVKSPSLRDMVSKIRKRPDDIDTPTSTNMMMVFERMTARLGIAAACENFINAYSDSERDAVRQLVKLNAGNIAADLQPPAAKEVDENELDWDLVLVDDDDTVTL